MNFNICESHFICTRGSEHHGRASPSFLKYSRLYLPPSDKSCTFLLALHGNRNLQNKLLTINYVGGTNMLETRASTDAGLRLFTRYLNDRGHNDLFCRFSFVLTFCISSTPHSRKASQQENDRFHVISRLASFWCWSQSDGKAHALHGEMGLDASKRRPFTFRSRSGTSGNMQSSGVPVYRAIGRCSYFRVIFF